MKKRAWVVQFHPSAPRCGANTLGSVSAFQAVPDGFDPRAPLHLAGSAPFCTSAPRCGPAAISIRSVHNGNGTRLLISTLLVRIQRPEPVWESSVTVARPAPTRLAWVQLLRLLPNCVASQTAEAFRCKRKNTVFNSRAALQLDGDVSQPAWTARCDRV